MRLIALILGLVLMGGCAPIGKVFPLDAELKRLSRFASSDPAVQRRRFGFLADEVGKAFWPDNLANEPYRDEWLIPGVAIERFNSKGQRHRIILGDPEAASPGFLAFFDSRNALVNTMEVRTSDFIYWLSGPAGHLNRVAPGVVKREIGRLQSGEDAEWRAIPRQSWDQRVANLEQLRLEDQQERQARRRQQAAENDSGANLFGALYLGAMQGAVQGYSQRPAPLPPVRASNVPSTREPVRSGTGSAPPARSSTGPGTTQSRNTTNVPSSAPVAGMARPAQANTPTSRQTGQPASRPPTQSGVQVASAAREQKPAAKIIQFKEGVVVCPPGDKDKGPWASGARFCDGPFQKALVEQQGPQMLGSLGNACGSSKGNIRELGWFRNHRVFGCGFGINPNKRGWPNIDAAAKYALLIPERITFRCEETQDGYCMTR
jgi:hypothetical protein